MPVHLVVFVAILFYLSPLSASDLVREQQIAAQVEAAILIGKPLRLRSGNTEFLAIHLPARKTRMRGGVLLLHDRGMHPDWPGVLHPLRSRLPDHGWDTLSLQMPLASPDAPAGAEPALIPEAVPRIAVGVAFLRQRGIDTIAIIGHGLGARMAIEYLQSGDTVAVRALVAVGLAMPAGASGGAGLTALQGVGIPLLDIYGSRDSDPVLASARDREDATRAAGNRLYRQDRVAGADHFFSGLDAALVSRVRSWLARIAGEG